LSGSFELSSPTRVTIGTVGPPGQRTFYFQARQDDQLVSLKMEKQQVLVLARGLQEVLSDLATPDTLPTDLALEEPVLAEWAVGAMQLAYDTANDRVVLLALELVDEDDTEEEGDEDDDEEDALAGLSAEELVEAVTGETGLAAEAAGGSGGMARFALTREQAAALVHQGEALVRSGRPPCPLCGYPLDPAGHSCPKTNGHRPPTL
jgi:uncharacterized repeat protein (TIGR03847 family)